MFRAEIQLPGHGDQVGDPGRAVPVDDGPGDADGIGVVQPHLAQQPQALPLLNRPVGKVVEGLTRGDIRGVQPQEGGEHRAVVAEHQVAAGAGPLQLVVVVHLGHLVQNDHVQVGFVLHQQLHHGVHQLHLGVVPVVEGELALGAAGQEGCGHQGYAGQGQNGAARRL